MFKRYDTRKGLTSLISDNSYMIAVDGTIMSQRGIVIPSVNEDGNLIVKVKSWRGLTEYKVMDLVIYAFKWGKLNPELIDKIESFPLDSNKLNINADNIGYRFKNGPVEVIGSPGFFYVPGYPGCAVDRTGRLLTTSNKEIRKWYIYQPKSKKNVRGGYRVTNVRHVDGQAAGITRHRALALTFLGYPDNVDSLVVNHINGIPGDDRLENLELVTRKYNNNHAFDNDLRSQNIKVLVRNVITGEVTEYRSISDAARKMGYPTDETIRQRLVTSVFGQVFQDGTQIKYKDDERDWIIPEDPAKAIADNQEKRRLIVKDARTGIVSEEESIAEFCRRTNLKREALSLRLKAGDLRVWHGYQFKYIEDVRDFPNVTHKEYNESLVSRLRPMVIHSRNIVTGKTEIYKTNNEAVRAGMPNTYLSRMKTGEQPTTSSGWQYKLSDAEWETIHDVEEFMLSLQTDIAARCEETGNISIFSSAKHAAQAHGIPCAKRLKKSALTQGNEVYRGYRWRMGVSNKPWPVTDVA